MGRRELIDLTPLTCVARATVGRGAHHAEASLFQLRCGALLLSDVYCAPALRRAGWAESAVRAVMSYPGEPRRIFTYAAPHGPGAPSATVLHSWYVRLGFCKLHAHPDAGPLQLLQEWLND